MSEVRYAHWDGKQLTYLQEKKPFMRQLLLSILTALKLDYECQGWKGVAEPADIVDSVLDDVYLLKVADGWVGFSLGCPWFMATPIVSEEFVTRGVPLADALAGLTALAKASGASRVVIGTRAAPHRRHWGLARTYERLGAAVSTIELTVEVP